MEFSDNMDMVELRSDKIDGKYILVRNDETREAVAIFKFSWALHKELVHKAHKSWDIINYDYSVLTESEVQTFLGMKVLPIREQEYVYEHRGNLER